MKVREPERQAVSPLLGKLFKRTFSTSIKDHMLQCEHKVAWDDFVILGREDKHQCLERGKAV